MDNYSPFLLDTNIYALFFQTKSTPALQTLETKIQCAGDSSFYIPEIVSMEIHSVLGKYMRSGSTAQAQACERQIQVTLGTAPQPCTHQFVGQARAKMNRKVFKAMHKLINDIEAGQGSIKAKIIPLENQAIALAKALLVDYAHQYSFGSHDALVAGTLLAAREAGLELTLVTADKGLKAACRAKGIDFFDPGLVTASKNTTK
jgi:predicted nucleic acid-binding protein